MSQEEIAEKMIDILSLTGPLATKLKKIHQSSAIIKRHTVRPLTEALFDHLKHPPKPSQLNTIYKQEAPKLALKAAKKAIAQWGGTPLQISPM